jgi:enoyl-CoA hydratase
MYTLAHSVIYEKEGHTAIFTLNRPEAKNAVNGEVSALMESYMDDFEADDEMWVGIIRSSLLDVFCAGADLKGVSKGAKLATDKGGFAGLVKYPKRKPLIAAVEGAALAGGCEIVLACDLVVASTKSRFGVPEVKRSLIAGAGGVFRLQRKLPRHVAMEMVLTGDPISSQRAYELGFVNRLTEPGGALEGAKKLAAEINVNAPIAVREAVNLVNQAHFVPEEEAWQMTAEAFRVVVHSEDFDEGPRAFVEKRAPKWTGKMKVKAPKAKL